MNPKVPRPAQTILNFLAQFESKGNYRAYFAHSNNMLPLPATVGGVLTKMLQMTARSHMPSSATGRYQLMHTTLSGLVKKYRIPLTTLFTDDFQDLMGLYLLEERGYLHWVRGVLTTHAFADDLSMEWASLPYHTGRSYYDGDGLNHSLVSRTKFVEMLEKAKGEKEMA